MSERKIIGEMEFQRFCEDGWQGWCAVECAGQFSVLEQWLESGERQVILDAACRRVVRHETADGVVYSKLMWAQNDGAYIQKELFSRMKWAWGPSRAVHILEVSAEMLAMGHRVAKPLLAVRKRRPGGWHWNLLVTEEVKAPTLEKIILEDESAPEAVEIAGKELACLHQDNFVHGDFLPRNTCLDATGRLVFLDNDKTRHTFLPPPEFLSRRNLAQFAYNLMLLRGLENCEEELPCIFLEAYAQTVDKPVEPIMASVLPKARKRWENKRARKAKLQA